MDSSEPLPREVTLDEAIHLAILLQRRDQLAEAQAVFDRVLAQAPDHPRALHYAGVLAHQQGRRAEAAALIARSLALVPDEADWHSNLGIVHQEEGRLDDAAACYRRAIAIDPRHANARSNLGVVLKARGEMAAAEAAYRAAIAIDPAHIDAQTNLGILLNALGRTSEAAACYCRVITLRPRHREARRLLALAHAMLGERDAAVAVLEEWIGEEPDDPVARHMLAACTGRAVPSRASDAFVEATFDSFAASFEAKLERLSYRAPALVAASIEASGVQADGTLDVLDAGCGTGLCGRRLAPYARQLTGIDLSAGMLAIAALKQVYDDLARAELTAYLFSHPASFDLIVSADTLVYFGDLTAVIEAASRALRPGGHFVFTLEHATDAGAGVESRLEVHGRYSHARPYVSRLLAAAGLAPEIVDAELRMESGVPVAGLVVRAMRVAS